MGQKTKSRQTSLGLILCPKQSIFVYFSPFLVRPLTLFFFFSTKWFVGDMQWTAIQCLTFSGYQIAANTDKNLDKPLTFSTPLIYRKPFFFFFFPPAIKHQNYQVHNIQFPERFSPWLLLFLLQKESADIWWWCSLWHMAVIHLTSVDTKVIGDIGD